MIKLIKDSVVAFFSTLTSDYKVFSEGPMAPQEMRNSFRQSALPALGYYFLLILSTVISTLGLLSNSSATIIGGMIISPLMHPIMTLAYGATVGERKLILRGLAMLGTGIPLVMLAAFLISSIINIRVIGSEVISRTHPNYLDLGVALASGLAGAFSYTRKSIANALPGVAIAVALVPPLCVVGVGAHSGMIGDFLASNAGIDEDMALGAFVLFFTNLWAILSVSIVVFLCQGYGQWKPAFTGFFVSLAMLGIVIGPLDHSFHKMYVREQFFRELMRFRIDEAKFSEMEVQSIDIRLIRGKYRAHIVLYANVNELDDLTKTQETLDRISERMEGYLGHPLRVELNIIPLYHMRSTPKAKS